MKRLAKLAFAAVALALLIRFVSPEALLAALRQADGRWVTAGIALLYTSQLLGSLNFHQILVARSARLGRMDVVRADLAGQFYALGLPGGLVVGAGIRLVHLARRGNMGKLLAGLVSSRLLETLTYAVTAALLLPFMAQRLGAAWLLWAAVGAILLVAGTGSPPAGAARSASAFACCCGGCPGPERWGDGWGRPAIRSPRSRCCGICRSWPWPVCGISSAAPG